MSELRARRDVWGWSGSLVLSTLVAVPLATALATSDDHSLTAALAATRPILVGTAAVVAAVLLHMQGRIGANDQTLSLSVGLGILGVTAITRGSCALLRESTTPAEELAEVLGYAVSAAVALTLLLPALRGQARTGALVVAGPASAGLVVLEHTLLTVDVGSAHDAVLLAGYLAVVALGVALAATYRQLGSLPTRTRTQVGVASVTTAVAVVIGAQWTGQLAVSLLATALMVVAAFLYLDASVALLGLIFNQGRDHVIDLRSRLAAAEATRRADRARLHEINTLVAGVASASHLVRDLPASAERDHLEAMVHDELERLQRLVAARGQTRLGSASPSALVDVDAVVGRIALAHRARGRGVETADSGLHAWGNADDIAEVLDILVENAARHGSPHDIGIRAARRPGAVTIEVQDGGPGVPPGVRNTLFGWGTHSGPGSGDGIGLYAADALARGLGGRLRLDTTDGGARFVLELRAPERTRHHDGLTSAAR